MVADAGTCGVEDDGGGMLRRRLRVAAAAACMVEGSRDGAWSLAVVVGQKSGEGDVSGQLDEQQGNNDSKADVVVVVVVVGCRPAY